MISITQEDIMRYWKTDNKVPIISVKCLAYNQDKYISQTLDGLLSQKTQYPFKVVVHDDASTDNTAKIIKEYEDKYPEIIYAIYETENQYSKPGYPLNKIVNSALLGKYIAWCEGDDYWIDPYKLERQVKYLEKHKDYGLVYTRTKTFYQKLGKFSKRKNGKKLKNYEDLFIHGNKIPTLTVCMRLDLYDEYFSDVNPDEKGWAMGDLPIWLWVAKNFKIKFLKKTTGIYRVLTESASHSNDNKKLQRFNESSYRIREFFANKYNEMYLLEEYKSVNDFMRAFRNQDINRMKEIYKKLSPASKNLKINVLYFSTKNKLFRKIIIRFVA